MPLYIQLAYLFKMVVVDGEGEVNGHEWSVSLPKVLWSVREVEHGDLGTWKRRAATGGDNALRWLREVVVCWRWLMEALQHLGEQAD